MAIAFGDSTGNSNTGSSTLTFAGPTVTGTDTILWVATYLYRFTSVNVPTYNGVAMTASTGSPVTVQSNRFLGLYYVVNPASGANVVITGTGTDGTRGIRGAAMYYTGASQTGIPDASDVEGPSSVTTITGTLTTVADNSWVVGAGTAVTSGDLTAGTGLTSRQDLGASGGDKLLAGDSNSAKTPAGSYSMTWNNSGGADSMASIMASFAPSVAVGPTTVKTWDGVTQSTGIKTYFGVDLANVKTVDGLT